jgi:hypothetical protein
MHSWGLYNGRFGLSNMVLIDKIAPQERPLADRMLEGELARQRRLRDELAKDAGASSLRNEQHILRNYKQLQFFDTLALYFNRIHPSERRELNFDHVPLDADHDVTVTIRPRENGIYEVSPYPFTADDAEFAYGGRAIEPQQNSDGGWPSVLAKAPTVWETFRLVPA